MNEQEAADAVVPYGSWPSPITPDMMARGGLTLSEPLPAGDAIHWLEGRPEEGGRYVLVRQTGDDEPRDLTPAGFNVRTRVHEYGGASYLVHGPFLLFANFTDQRLYRQDLDGHGASEPRPITPEPPAPAAHRFADARITPDGSLLACVRERHGADGAVNELVVLATDGSDDARIIAGGHDFFSSPRVSPDGSRLAWLAWDHPNMPWDGTELWVAALRSDGTLGEPRPVAGGAAESIVQPEWSPDGILHFVSDRTGWWNLYRERQGTIEGLHPSEQEFGAPAWVFGMASYAFLSDGSVACIHGPPEGQRLGILDPADGSLRDLDVGFQTLRFSIRSDGARLALVAGGPETPPSVISLSPPDPAVRVHRRAFDASPEVRECISSPRPVEFPTDGGLTAHSFFYPPRNPSVRGPAEERPPLIVMSHGGPTSQVGPDLLVSIQFWTSRGFGVVDVNYGGSTGYGRAYRERLRGAWGVLDMNDCANAARWLAEACDVDGRRLAIRGGSAGGYTTLCALTFRDDFSAGASYFGIGDLESMARDTHKFESRYLDGLIAPYPERADVYRERSPIHFAGRISCPVILFQGLEDEVVPPNQAEDMIKALEANGIPYAYLAFEGEQHGFRKAETIKRSLEAELFFYGKVFGFEPAGDIEPVEVVGL